jgi:hypothetical protein
MDLNEQIKELIEMDKEVRQWRGLKAAERLYHINLMRLKIAELSKKIEEGVSVTTTRKTREGLKPLEVMSCDETERHLDTTIKRAQALGSSPWFGLQAAIENLVNKNYDYPAISSKVLEYYNATQAKRRLAEVNGH